MGQFPTIDVGSEDFISPRVGKNRRRFLNNSKIKFESGIVNMEASNPQKTFVKRSKTLSESSVDSDVDMTGTRNRSGSVNLRDAVTTPEVKLENFLYDKYLGNFFNPLHPKGTGDPGAAKCKGILYDVEGKFSYCTYSEEMRSYHPMLDIKALKKDLK